MKLIMMRHAARSSHDAGDSSLNNAGRAQAEALAIAVTNKKLPTPSTLLCSPKKRAKETLSPLASSICAQLNVDDRLDERQKNETAADFEDRVRFFLYGITNEMGLGLDSKDDCILLCSHLDWLELAPGFLDTQETAIGPGWQNCSFQHYNWKNGIWVLSSHGVITPQ